MKRLLLLTLLPILLAACYSLPLMIPMEPSADLETACEALFPRQPWRMVHTIKTAFPDRREGVMMGVVALTPQKNAVACALLTIEGLRLFEAHDDGTLTVRRALPPFDRPALAEGMMADIRLLFFAPEGPPLLSGTLPSGARGCRYARADGYVDVVQQPDGHVGIRRYDRHHRLTRRVTITRCHPDGLADQEAVPCRIHLEAFHPADYLLDLDLVEARPEVDKSTKPY